MIRFILLLFIVCLFPCRTNAQDLDYAKTVVATLASSEFKGRGYVDAGDRKAAEYIHDEFKKIGLQPFKKNYYQTFTTSVNTFPGKMQLVLGDQELVAGADYLISAGAPGIKGTFETVWLEMEEIFDTNQLGAKLRNSPGKFLVIPAYDRKDFDKDQLKHLGDVVNFLKYHPDNPAAGVVELTDGKLTWSASTVAYTKPSFTVNTEKVPGKFSTVTVDVESKFVSKYKSQNVLGYIDGQNNDSLMVFIAHYDHLGMMGDQALFPGANDNASGVAMLLNLARFYQVNKPRYRTVFIAFGGEELGLVGAKHFVENPLFDLEKIKFLLNFDISGTGDDGIQVVNGSVYQEQFDKLKQINEEKDLLKQVKIRGEACNSDHCMFHMKKVPCFFIYTLGGIQAYHDIYDKSETLPLTEFNDYFKLITKFVEGL